jgi:hypothetical protein
MPVLTALLLLNVSLDAQESFNDALEEKLDALCRDLKAGSRKADFPRPQALVWVTSCSVRALRLDGRTRAHLLYELEGRDAIGARLTERGEVDARLTQKLELTDVTPTFTQVVRRDPPRFVEVASKAGLVLDSRTVSPDETMLGGLAVRDVDGDGRLDVIAVDGHTLVLFLQTSPLGLGRPQLYVANDVGAKDLSVFDSDGGVRNVAKERGLDDPGNGMGVEVGDPFHDGRLLTLEDAVLFFDVILGTKLSADERSDLTAYLRAL